MNTSLNIALDYLRDSWVVYAEELDAYVYYDAAAQAYYSCDEWDMEQLGSALASDTTGWAYSEWCARTDADRVEWTGDEWEVVS